jgi:hypothetical protein
VSIALSQPRQEPANDDGLALEVFESSGGVRPSELDGARPTAITGLAQKLLVGMPISPVPN